MNTSLATERGLRYGPVSWDSSHRVGHRSIKRARCPRRYRMCRPPFRVEEPFPKVPSTAYQAVSKFGRVIKAGLNPNERAVLRLLERHALPKTRYRRGNTR